MRWQFVYTLRPLAAAMVLLSTAQAHDPGEETCVLEESFQDDSRWEQLAPNAGIDLSACGLNMIADTGAFSVTGGKLILTPGANDDLQLDNPIAIASLSREASVSTPDDYRVRFNFIAHEGMVTVAVFTRVRYGFDADAGTLDPAQFSAMGVNWTFDNHGHDVNDFSDHLHSDIRLQCLQEGRAEPRQIDYPGFLMTSEREWTMVLDVKGDNENGPVSLLVKLYPAGDAEPETSFAAFTLEGGFGPDPGLDMHSSFLVAALGAGSLEISDLSVCSIPTPGEEVQHLACALQHDGTAHVTWENPAGADLADPIRVLVNGVEVASLAGESTEYTTAPLPAGDAATITVINFSGHAAACTVGGTPEFHFLRGDCNSDLKADISDAIFNLDYLFTGNADPACLEACNADGGPEVDISDPIFLLRHVFLGDAPPPEPYPGCGHGDAILGCSVEQCPHL